MAQHDQNARDSETYITLDTYNAAKGDAAGFGFGGAGGFGGGFGIGGNGPQPEDAVSGQAHYREEAKPGVELGDGEGVITAPNADVETRDHPRWLDGFPNSFHGWGPNAPDYDAHVEHDSRQAAQTDNPAEGAQLFMTSGAAPFATGLIWNRPA